MKFYSISNKLLYKSFIIYIIFFGFNVWAVVSNAQEVSNLKHENITLDSTNIVLKHFTPTKISTDVSVESHTSENSDSNNLKLNATASNTVNTSQNVLTTSVRPDHDINQTTEKVNIISTTIINDKNGNNMSDFTIPSQSPDISNVTNTSTTTVVPAEPVLPDKGSAEEEHNSSMSIFFVLCVLALGILLIHLMLQTNFQYLPESVVIVFLGGAIGMIINLMSNQNIANWRKEEAFSPTAFFLVLLPPIIFESGYNLHKGNFFQNIGSILVFAIFGTAISAFVIGAGIYLLGLAQVAYKLSFVESFAFGSLISAVDPVATVAIFHALEVDPVLNMLVFGESILNDAISIVLTTSVLESNNATTTSEAIILGLNRFCLMFFASAGIGVVFALISALLLKHVDLRKNPSLEFGLMLVFTYAPYVLAEGIQLSGIMAILFNGIVMSHYTHFNLSTVTQITMQQTMRTLAFIAETCVFAYLGLALFSFRHRVEPALVIWSIVLCLIGRAANIFPLAFLVNRFREHQITRKMMFIMWFSGLRGAISYALSLHLDFSDETRHVIITTTLIIVLFTTLIFGGSTMPLLKFLRAEKKQKSNSRRKRKDKEISLSKTREWGQTIDSEHLSELTEEEIEVSFLQSRIRGFARWDLKFFIPFFTRRFTQQELKDCKSQMTDLTNQWYQAIRISPMESDDEVTTASTAQLNINLSVENQNQIHGKQSKRRPSHGEDEDWSD
ncbi:na[+]/H[+] hydrogen exchanger 1 isoform X2 [Bombus vancouverensis nearcticus]|uniref:Sodium/hydrogen exchanger n=1 Tax=Bombus bifarius TaxID=103933 RepID=A0A6P8LHV2_9HYME|nr:sodium/hydrogen exchanger 8 [Bombus vancouverensis nearcticus]XP_033297819.1 sodium/hydrogen exchanger 8 [Bombus bifarius]